MRLVLLTLVSLALGGCMAEPGVQSGAPGAPVNTGLNALMNGKGSTPVPLPPPPEPAQPTAVERLAQDHKVDVQAILDRDPAPPQPEPAPVNPEPAMAEAATPEPAPTVAAPPKTIPERIDETSLLLTDLLRQHAATSDTPFKTALALAAMEVIRPGSAPKVITPDQTDGGPLTDEERDLANAFRDLVAGLAAAAGGAGEKPGALTDRAVDLGNAFARARPMRIRAELAAKVTGYGQYIPLAARTLQQGKPARAIVYTEIKRFTQRPLKEGDGPTDKVQPGDRWVVELSQELQLIHDADGVKAWQRAEAPIVETSRSFRTDFFLVQDITLPPSLSIGAYKLKVIVRDKSSGHEDEAIIPLQVVADPSLVTESASRLSD